MSPKFVNIKIKSILFGSKYTQHKIKKKLCINQELKYLYKKKAN